MHEEHSSREARKGESAEEVVFWQRYWKAAREDGVAPGKEVWHERVVWRFIQFLRPRRLRERTAADVTEWLRLLATQPGSEAWRVQQANRALRILYQRVVRQAWAEPWPAGFLGEELTGTWLEVSGRVELPVRLGEGEVRRVHGVALEKVVRALRLLHYAHRTEETYVGWAVRFLRICGEVPAGELGTDQVRDFLEQLAVRGQVAAATQNQALNALVFFFREGLGRELGELGRLELARRPRRLPVVLTESEVDRLLGRMQGVYRLMGQLMYGCGLRLMECVRLRVQDVDFDRGQIVVRCGKGAKDRVVMLPEALGAGMREQLRQSRRLYEVDVGAGGASVYVPEAVAHKHPGAGREWGWQWVLRPTDYRWIRAGGGCGGIM